jgi:hypothetical protein
MKTLEEIWAKVNRDGFLSAMESLSDKGRVAFLESLVLKIQLKDKEDYLKLGLGAPGVTLPSQEPMSNSNSVVMVAADGADCKFPIIRAESHEYAPIPEITFSSQYNNIFRLSEGLLYGKDNLPWFAYTTVNISPELLEESPDILIAIEDCKETSGVHDTLIVKGILSRAWDEVQADFYFGMFAQVLYVAMLMWVAGCARDKRLPPTALIIAIMGLTIYTMLLSLVEVAAGVWARMEGDYRRNRTTEEITEADTYKFYHALPKVIVLPTCFALGICFLIASMNTSIEAHRSSHDDGNSIVTLGCSIGALAFAFLGVFCFWFFKPQGEWCAKSCLLSIFEAEGKLWLTLTSFAGLMATLLGQQAYRQYNSDLQQEVSTDSTEWSLGFLGVSLLSGFVGMFLKAYWVTGKELKAMWNHIYIGHFWTLFEFVMAMYGVSLIAGFTYFAWSKRNDLNPDPWSPSEQFDDCFTYEHPTWIAIFIFFKLQQVIQKSLCIRGIGESVIPAYNALFDKASTRVILFAFLLWANSFFTYYAIPVVLSRNWLENIWLVGVNMYRLDFIGDFDLNSLEGLDPVVRLNNTSNGSIGKISDATHFQPWHKAVGLLTIAFFFFMNIGLLNVYIGIVSELYHQNYLYRKEFFEKYRTVYIYKGLVMSRAWKGLTHWFKRCFCYMPDGDVNAGAPAAVWLMYNPKEDDIEEGELKWAYAQLEEKCRSLEEDKNKLKEESLKHQGALEELRRQRASA